jgi:hypothetical protein
MKWSCVYGICDLMATNLLSKLGCKRQPERSYLCHNEIQAKAIVILCRQKETQYLT